MFRTGDWKLTAALLVGLSLAGPGAAADDEPEAKPDAAKNKPGWFSRMFGRKDKDKDKEKEKEDEDKAAEAAEKAAANRPRIDSAASARARELRDYLRRLEVCDQLMQVAFDTHDDQLQRQVEQLKERVWLTYQQRTERLPGGGGVSPADQQILDRHLGSRAAKDRPEDTLLAEPADGRASRTAQRKEDGR